MLRPDLRAACLIGLLIGSCPPLAALAQQRGDPDSEPPQDRPLLPSLDPSLKLRPGVQILVRPTAPESGVPRSSSAARAERTAVPAEIRAAPSAATRALPGPETKEGAPRVRAIDEFQYQFLTRDGLRYKNNLPVEFVSTQNENTTTALRGFLARKRAGTPSPGTRSIERRGGDAPAPDVGMTETVVVREFLRRAAKGEAVSLDFEPDARQPYLFNGVPVTGGGGEPFVIGGEPVLPTPLEGFPAYRDNQSAFVTRARVLHGQFTDDFLDVVLLSGAGNAICTGTLIAPDTVLSAAHCACGFRFSEVRFGSSRNHSSPIAIEGEPVVFDPSMCDQRDLSSWDLANWKKGDVALYKLQRQAEIEPRGLAPAALVDRAQFVMVVGFGKTEFNNVGGFKYKAEVPVATATCSQTDLNDDGVRAPDVFGCAEGRELVASSKDLRDTCTGDSGGPAYVRLRDGNGEARYFLAGVTSRSVLDPAQECGTGGIYVRVHSEVQNWLRAHVPELVLADEELKLASTTTN